MKFDVVGVLCFLSVSVYQCDSFQTTGILKTNDYLHPTTTTTVIPIPDVYKKEDPSTEGATDTYNTEDHDGEDETSKSSSTFDRTSNRPFTPENFSTIAPPDVAEVNPGMKKHSTTPGYGNNQTIQPEQVSDKYYTDNKEILTTPQTNPGADFNDQVNYEQTSPNTFLDSVFLTTTPRTSDPVNDSQVRTNRNETSNAQLVSGNSEGPLVQPAPTHSQASSTSKDSSISPDDPSLKEPEPEKRHGTQNSDGDQLSIPVTGRSRKAGAAVLVGMGSGRGNYGLLGIINGPTTDCGEGRQLDFAGKCRRVVRR